MRKLLIDILRVDTIAAISTASGRGGVGMVRLSGSNSLQIAAGICRSRSAEGLGFADSKHHAVARLVSVLHPSFPGIVLDTSLVTVFHAPRSYTGETVVEIATHGSPVVLNAVLEAALKLGARLAEPGEFTRRAFLNGKLDLTQAEAVHDLIAAQTLDQARTAARQMGGALSRRVAPAKEALLELIARLEAAMDFATGELDDVDLVPATRISLGIMQAREPLRTLAATFRRGMLERTGAALALVGPPNAGKSSLFNRLLERERAIVTPAPGTTRDTLEEALVLGGIPLRLVDTAGLRASHADEAERIGMERSRETLADADLVLQVHDATQPWTEDEVSMARGLRGDADPAMARPHIVIQNKSDLVMAALDPSALVTVRTSAVTGEGLDELRAAILRALNAEGSLAEGAGLNNVRQQQAVAQTLEALDRAEAANEAGLPHEVLLLDLHAALTALDSLTGVTTTDDILARIFSTFCIGK